MSDHKKGGTPVNHTNNHGANHAPTKEAHGANQDHSKKKHDDHHHHGGGAKVIPLRPDACLAEGCKQKSVKASFCIEHFDWFKEGLITKEGRKPSDFDKKFYAYQNRKARKAA